MPTTSKTALFLLALAALLLIPGGAALAQETIRPPGSADTWTFYAFANGHAMANILEAVKRFVDNRTFINFMVGMALLGMLSATWAGFMQMSLQKVAMYFVGLAVAVWAIFSVKVDIFVEDVVWDDSTPMYGRYVSDVPAAIGLPASMISEVGMWLTSSIETNFTTPGYAGLRLSDGAPIGIAASMLNDMQNARINDPWLRGGMQEFIMDCVMPQVYNGYISPHDLLTVDDIWEVFGRRLNPAIYTVVYSSSVPGGEVEECTTAYATLTAQLEDEGSNILSQMTGSSFNQAMAGSLMAETAFNDAMSWANGGPVNRSGSEVAIQAAMSEIYSSSHAYAAMATGSNEVLAAMNIEQARLAQPVGWYTASVLFRDMAGYFYAVLQAFVIGLAPLVLVLFILPGLGKNILIGYSMILVWLMLWWPGLAITNFVMSLFLQQQFAGMLTDGISVSEIGKLSKAASNLVLASGFLSTLVPAIMYGIVSRSGYAMVSVLDRASGAGHATQAATSASQGSASSGQVSVNNANMNAHQTSMRYSTGDEVAQFHSGQGAAFIGNTSLEQVQQGTQMASSTVNMEARESLSHATAEYQQASETYQRQLQSSLQSVVQQGQRYAESQGFMENGGIDLNRMAQDQQGSQYLAAASALVGKLNDAGSTETGLESTRGFVEGSLGFSLGSGVRAGGRHERGSTTEHTEGERESVSTQQQLQVGDNGSITITGSDGSSYSYRFNENQQREALESVLGTSTVTEMNSQAEQYQEARENRETAERAWQASQSQTWHQDVRPGDRAAFDTRVGALGGAVASRQSDTGQALDGQGNDLRSMNLGHTRAYADLAENGVSRVTDMDGNDVDVRGRVEQFRSNAGAPVRPPRDGYDHVQLNDQVAAVRRSDAETVDSMNQNGHPTTMMVGAYALVNVGQYQGQALYEWHEDGEAYHALYSRDGGLQQVHLEGANSSVLTSGEYENIINTDSSMPVNQGGVTNVEAPERKQIGLPLSDGSSAETDYQQFINQQNTPQSTSWHD